MKTSFPTYARNLSELLCRREWDDVEKLAQSIAKVWQEGRQFFLCGNGGSAANATHLANDFLYGISSTEKSGLDVESLTANTSVLTCLANDEGYDEIFSIQLEAKVNEYLSLIMRLIFAFGLSFQLPVLLNLLARVGFVDSEYLKKRRKYVIIIIFAVAAILTPPDPITQIGLGIPLLILYELSILSVKIMEKKKNDA